MALASSLRYPKLTQVIDRVLGFSDRILEAGHKSANIAGPDEMQSVYALQRAGQRLPTPSGSSENGDEFDAPVLAVDIGGTRIAAALVTQDGRTHALMNLPTEAKQGGEAVINRVRTW